jgi:hypothetical protein
MAQRKPPSKPSAAGKSANKSAQPRPTSTASGKPSGKASGKPSTKPASKPTPTKAASKAMPKASAARPPVKRKPGKSIVNQKQRPWGIIATAVVLVLVAGGIIAYAVTRNSGGSNHVTVSRGGQPVNLKDPYRHPELAAAKKIPGMTYRVEGQHTHVEGNIKYASSPPRGGDHSQVWGDCTGTVYDQPIANENAVHMLEHGAIWITYNPNTATADDIAALKKDVEGVNYMALSPYPDLKAPISLQAWGYQLFVQKASDPRVQQFISVLRHNPQTTPENASCSDPPFKEHPSTFGNPVWTLG